MKIDAVINKEKTKTYISIFLILFLSAGFTSVNDIMPNYIVKTLWITLLFILLCTLGPKINKSRFIITIVLCIIILFSTFINGASMMNAFNYCFGFLCVFFLVNCVDIWTILKCYVGVLYALCGLSLVCWIFFWTIPAIRPPFYVTNAAGNIFSDILLFSFNANVVGIPRNQGMFWEPGAFSTFITLALIFETLNDSINIKRIIIFLIAILTTFSTTGYFAVFLYLIYLYFKYSNNITIRRRIFVLILLISLTMIQAWGYLSATGTYSVFGKIIDFKNSGSYGVRVTSVSLRIDSVIKPISVFLDYPILGCGNEKINIVLSQYTHGMNTCTFINWFAIYGIFFGMIMVVGFFKVAKIIVPNKPIMRLLVLVLLFLSVISENFVNSPIIFMIALLGYGYSERNANLIIDCAN